MPGLRKTCEGSLSHDVCGKPSCAGGVTNDLSSFSSSNDSKPGGAVLPDDDVDSVSSSLDRRKKLKNDDDDDDDEAEVEDFASLADR